MASEDGAAVDKGTKVILVRGQLVELADVPGRGQGQAEVGPQ